MFVLEETAVVELGEIGRGNNEDLPGRQENRDGGDGVTDGGDVASAEVTEFWNMRRRRIV